MAKKKMLTNVLIFGLLCNVICTGFGQIIIEANSPTDEKLEAEAETTSTHYVIPECNKLPCASMLIKRQEKMHKMNTFLEAHNELIEDPTLNEADKVFLKNELDKVKRLTDKSAVKLNSDLDELCRTPDAEVRRDWCMQEIKIHRQRFKDLISAAKKFKRVVYAAIGNSTAYYLQYMMNDIPQD